MPYSYINSTRNGDAMLDYLLKEDAHSEGKDRNVYIASYGFLPNESVSYYDQCKWYRTKASEKNKTEMRQIIVSFSEKELPPDDPKSYDTARTIGFEIAEKGYPGHPFIIAVQNDGQGGKVHIHMMSPNCSIDGRGFTDEQTKHYYLKQQVDEVCQAHFELDTGRDGKERVTKTEKGRRLRNVEIAKENEAIRARNAEIAKQNAVLPKDQQVALEEEKPLVYIWKDDLRERITASMENATSREQFLQELTRHGVEGEYRNTKGNGEFIVYQLTDLTKFDGEVKLDTYFKCKSYKLGADYDLTTLDQHIQENLSGHKPAPVAAEPVEEVGEDFDLPEIDIPEADEPEEEISVAGFNRSRQNAKERAEESAKREERLRREEEEKEKDMSPQDEADDKKMQMLASLIQDMEAANSSSTRAGMPDDWDFLFRRRR